MPGPIIRGYGLFPHQKREYLHIYHHGDVSGIRYIMSVTHVSMIQYKISSVIVVNM